MESRITGLGPQNHADLWFSYQKQVVYCYISIPTLCETLNFILHFLLHFFDTRLGLYPISL